MDEDTAVARARVLEAEMDALEAQAARIPRGTATMRQRAELGARLEVLRAELLALAEDLVRDDLRAQGRSEADIARFLAYAKARMVQETLEKVARGEIVISL